MKSFIQLRYQWRIVASLLALVPEDPTRDSLVAARRIQQFALDVYHTAQKPRATVKNCAPCVHNFINLFF